MEIIVKIKTHSHKLLLSTLAVVVLVFVSGASSMCYGQFAKYDQLTGTIEIDLGTTKVKLSDVQKIYLDGASSGSTVYQPSQIRQSGGGGLTSYLLLINAPPGMPANLAAQPVQLDVLVKRDPDKDEVTVIPVRVNQASVATTYSAMLASLKLERTNAKGKDDAELYLSGEVSTAVKSKPNWTADIKYEREFGKRGFPLLFAPFFSLKYNSKILNDTDKVSFGIRFSNSFGFKTAAADVEEDKPINLLLLNNVASERTPKFTKIKRQREQREYFLYKGSAELESDWDFKVTNLITSQELHYLLKPVFLYGGDEKFNGKLIFTPFVGAELGGNLKNPTDRDELGIARLKAGAVLTLSIEKPIKNFFIKNLVWENKFTQRWFLANEFAYDKNDDGSLVEKAFGKTPRSHVTSAFEFKLNDYFGPAITYEWGEAPPLYKKARHKVKLALVYSFKRKALP
jgi:hypothetical protein